MRIRFFGSPNCKDCMEVFVLLNKFQIDYEYIDAVKDDEYIQELCDEYEIEELPHLQFFIDDNIILQYIGLLTEVELIKYMVYYFSDY